MSKNLEELIKFRDCVFFIYGTHKRKRSDLDIIESDLTTKIIYRMICILEDFEKQLKTVKAELGIYTKEEIKNIKVGGTDSD